eukprot:TRINITY_DN19895_c0_g2_i1.p1 TRINITY_DN19895_c0_g2~~TRINITY_DN19895_c0_g2_i1.p1  ORF type:complete len:447 (+),score=43.96 TRINITY_DN19895_c0_g2_i1:51-1391(+)
MALCNSILLIFFFFSSLSLSNPKTLNTQKPQPLQTYNFSLSFPLTSLPRTRTTATLLPYLSSTTERKPINPNPKNPYAYRSSFKYTMALVVSLPIGTPPQTQYMVLDTGSQLSWIQCLKKTLQKPPSSFDPSLSSSFSDLPCNTPLCKPRIPDYTLPTSCDQNRLCHYSYFYADGTLAEGNLVREKISLSNSQTTPPLILGCARDSGASEGILGMNLGRLSFTSQAKIQKFSYCVPPRRGVSGTSPAGTFYLGENPSSGGFRYVDLLRFGGTQPLPYLDKAAYTVGMEGIRIGGKKLNISRSVFRPDSGGAGQTMVDSGTEFTFLVEGAYDTVREEVARLVGRRLKKGFVYGGALDLCVNGDVAEIGRLVGDVVLELERGVEIVVERERVFADVGGGVGCFSIGSSALLGIESNIIGNFHQQNLWVEFDVLNSRVGFAKADCSKGV